MTRIGIDARLWGVKHTGIGRYVEQLVTNLKEIDDQNEYVLFLRKEDMNIFDLPANWKKVEAEVRHYTFKEQLVLPLIFSREKLDLLHVPHYNAPLLYRGKLLMTIHDLTWHNFTGIQATTLFWPVYLIKYLAYKLVVNSAIKRAVKIITPSFTVKNELMKKFSLANNKLEVTYEAVYPQSENTMRTFIEKKYLLYVGNLYPHKNVEILVKAIGHLESEMLVVVCSRNVFWERFQKFLEKNNARDLVQIRNNTSDKDLIEIYKGAKVFIFPSLSEGFGLPGLEAMKQGTPVVCSDIPVFREIYKDAAIYFNPKDEKDIAEKIKNLLKNDDAQKDLKLRGLRLVKQFSWRKMAEETLIVYKSCIGL